MCIYNFFFRYFVQYNIKCQDQKVLKCMLSCVLRPFFLASYSWIIMNDLQFFLILTLLQSVLSSPEMQIRTYGCFPCRTLSPPGMKRNLFFRNIVLSTRNIFCFLIFSKSCRPIPNVLIIFSPSQLISRRFG